MADTALLRRRLLRALDLAPLTLAAASMSCGAEATAQQQRLEAAKQRERSARDAEESARMQAEAERAKQTELAKPVELPNFSCPTGEWCGSKTIAERYAGAAIEGKPSALDCPGNLAPLQRKPGDPPHDPTSEPPGTMGYADLDRPATEAERAKGQADLCCYDWGSLCGGGRPLLDHGQPKFAVLERIGSPRRLDLDLDLDPRIAAGWLDDARMEHASIASFLRAEAELAALAAPLALREACLRAADDERRHARDCFAIAAEYGEAWQARELPHADLRPASLEQLAVDTLLEGGIGETIAALMARRAARAVHADPQRRAVLERIAADELEHAALAWQTIAWAVQQGGEPIRTALQRAAAQARPQHFELPAADPNAEQLASHGRLDARAKARAIRDAWCELIDPVLRRLSGRGRASRPTERARRRH